MAFHTYVGLCMTALFSRYVLIESFSDASQSHLGSDTQFLKLDKLVALLLLETVSTTPTSV